MKIGLGPGVARFFPPEVATHLVKIACEMPDQLGRSLSQWDCAEFARHLMEQGTVDSISARTVLRVLNHHKLKPWRIHYWQGAKTPRDAAFLQTVREICDLYTRDLPSDEIVLSMDEKTQLQPRTRPFDTRPAAPGRTVQVEHEYTRARSVNLFAAFNTRTGKVQGKCYARKRSIEFIDFLEYIDQTTPAQIKVIHVVLDNARSHKSRAVREWLARHPRFVFHFTPVHCSWMNQVEQWFGVFQRKRFRVVNFASLTDLEAKILQYIEQYNDCAHRYNWTPKSFRRVIEKAEKALATAA